MAENEMIDSTPLGQLAARTMDTLYERFGESAHIRDVAIVVEVDMGPSTAMLLECTDDRPWVMQAFLWEAQEAVSRGRNAVEHEE